jgi:asparagine N-glycosylation enzyme membrane subunit Stt3
MDDLELAPIRSVPLSSLYDKEPSMLWTIAVILLVLWLLGMVSSYTLGGFIHILLILAIIAVLVRVIQGRSPV